MTDSSVVEEKQNYTEIVANNNQSIISDNNKTASNKSNAEDDDFTLNCNEIIDGLYLGSEDAAHVDIELLMKYNIKYIICAGFGLSAIHQNSKCIEYKKLKCIDLPIYDIIKDVQSSIKYIEDNFRPKENRNLLIHCARGKSRSASITIAYMMYKYTMSYADAYYHVRQKRSLISINSGFEKQLRDWGDQKCPMSKIKSK